MRVTLASIPGRTQAAVFGCAAYKHKTSLEFCGELFERQSSLLNNAFERARLERFVLRDYHCSFVLPKNKM